VAGLGMGGVGGDGSALRAAGSMGDWNQARDGAISAHTDAGGQCSDAVEAGVGVTGRHAYYTRVRETGALGGRKRYGAAYVMPDWTGRMANSLIKINVLPSSSDYQHVDSATGRQQDRHERHICSCNSKNLL